MNYQRASGAPEAEGERQRTLKNLKRKRAFWRNVSWYGFLMVTFWMTWVIGGLREEWLAPWPVVPTIVWGAFLLYHAHRLGGRAAIRHETMEDDVEQLRQSDDPVFRDRLVKRPIVFGDSAAYTPIRPFHLQEVIDAREARADEQVSEPVS